MKKIESQKSSLHAKGICVIIPTYNNGKTVGDVVKETLLYCDDVIVVNDGSTDDTLETLKAIEGITIVSYPENRGKGIALKEGFKKALDMNFAFAITLDADGQHYPKYINSFARALKKNPGTLIVGDRNLKGADRSFGSKFANKFSDFWFFVQTGQYLNDTQTGYRLYPLKKLKGFRFMTSRYEAELELLVFASWNGVKIKTIPIDVFYPPREERVSHFRPTKDFTRITILNTILCGLAVVYGLPMRIFRALMTFLRTAYSIVFILFFSIVVFSPIFWLYFNIGKMTEKKKYNTHRFIHWASRFIILTHGIPGVKFTYKVNKGVNFDKPSVIICNHQSHLDLMGQLIFTPKIVFLTKDWVMKNPLYGIFIKHADYIPVSEGIDAILPTLRVLAQKGYSIAVFPEGTRSKTCEIGRFHKGAFYIAEKLNLGITPMYLYGAGRVLKKGTYHLEKGQMHIEVGTEISREELASYGDTRHQASYFHKLYIKKYDEMCHKFEQDA